LLACFFFQPEKKNSTRDFFFCCRYVYLPDKRLGAMYYTLMVAVLIYAIVTIVVNKGDPSTLVFKSYLLAKKQPKLLHLKPKPKPE
jgi:hypothetical protein